MTPRSLARMPRACLGAVTLGLGLIALAGCDPRQMMYFLQPFGPEIKAPGPSLKGKRVVLLVKAVPGTSNDFASLDRDIARELGTLLRQKVKKLDLVDIDKVLAWDRAHPGWSDAAEAGTAFEADMVVFLEVNQFQVQDPRNIDMFEGTSRIHVRVVEMKYPTDSRDRPMKDKPLEGDIVYENDRETIFPVRGPLPASAGINAATFKNKFLKLVCTELSWDFVAHEPGDNIQDAKFDTN